ncbi:MAG TPA: polyprenyl synthetase family protein [Dehalococcoidia bacterium]|nr:polyprenyl synthetase family protein [Dehalococcoidia bacterium]
MSVGPKELVAPSARYSAAVLRELRSAFGDSSLPLYAMMRYHLGWEDVDGRPAEVGGKGLRPLLCLLGCEAAGGDWQRALPAAAALELLHNFTLVHDDIQDQSDRRRHRPTVWSLWGAAQGINVGDGLFALAERTLLRLRQTTSAEVALAAAGILNDAVILVCEGQYMDMDFEGRVDVSLPEYLAMIERKAGVLMGAAAELGALIAGNEGARAPLRRFGLALGVAFQMRDDLLGLWGDEAVTGKSAESDIRQRKKSLPVVWAMTHGPSRPVKRLRDLYGRAGFSEADVHEVLELLEEAGARKATEELVLTYSRQAIEALEGLSLLTGPAAELATLTQALARRDM